MNRTLLIVSILALALGLELSAGAFSRTVEGFRLGFVALSEFPRYGDLPMGFVAGLILVAGGAGGLGVWAWSRWWSRSFVRSRHCPRCGQSTKRVRRRLRHRILGRVLGIRVSRRLCRECDWSGLAAPGTE